jgi:hypothetical protein
MNNTSLSGSLARWLAGALAGWLARSLARAPGRRRPPRKKKVIFHSKKKTQKLKTKTYGPLSS